MPTLAKFIAMPPPIVPAPSTPHVSMSRIGVSLAMSGILFAARSAKNAYRWAADWAPVTSSTNSFLSTFRPSSNGRLAAASMHWMLYSGARKPRDLLGDRRAELGEQFGVALGLGDLVVTVADPLERQASATAWLANATAAARRAATSPSAVTSSISPLSSASALPMWRPDVIISSAFGTPTRRGSRWVPPAPGSRPRLTSGRPNFAEATAPPGSGRTARPRGRRRAPCRGSRRSRGPAHPPSPPGPPAGWLPTSRRRTR